METKTKAHGVSKNPWLWQIPSQGTVLRNGCEAVIEKICQLISFKCLETSTRWRVFLTFSLFLSPCRRAWSGAEENLYKMGQLTSGTGLLPHYRPLHGPTGWTHAHQAPGGSLGREAGEFPSDSITWWSDLAETWRAYCNTKIIAGFKTELRGKSWTSFNLAVICSAFDTYLLRES